MSAARKAGHEQRRAIARRPPAAAPPAPATASPPLFRLQRQAGNLAVQQLLPTVGDRAAGRLGAAPPGRGAPATPVVEAPDSPLERAAERHANQILRRQSATVVPGAEPGVPERVGGQRGSAALAPEIVGHVLASAGHPIEPPTRQLFESRFGRDFSRVRVHSDERAADSARSVGALAYTVGSDVVFGSGGYAPGTDSGRRLLAHELSHVLQDEGSSHARLHRQASGAVKGADPAAVEQLQLPSGGNLQAAQAVMAAVQGIAAAADGSYVTTYQGRRIVMTGEQAQRVRSAAGQALQGALNRSRRRLDDAVGRYQAHQSVARDFWFFSRAVSAFTWVRTLGAHSDPGEAIASQQANLNLAVAAAQQSIQAGALVNAAAYLADADAASERTARLVRVYIDQLIEGGESLATGLEYTRDAAFITLGVLAVIVTGGAAAGVAPGVIGTGIGGLSVGATATAISVAAPIVANVGVGLAKVADGDPVDWGSIAVDAAVQILLARFGGKLGEGVFGKVAGSPATRTLARQAVASVASGVATHEVGQAFAVSAHHAYNALRGRPVTWGNFVDDLTTRLADPKGLFIAAAMSSVQLGAHVAVDRRLAARPPSAGPAPAVQRPAAPQPPPSPPSSRRPPNPLPSRSPSPRPPSPPPPFSSPRPPNPSPSPRPSRSPSPRPPSPLPPSRPLPPPRTRTPRAPSRSSDPSWVPSPRRPGRSRVKSSGRDRRESRNRHHGLRCPKSSRSRRPGRPSWRGRCWRNAATRPSTRSPTSQTSRRRWPHRPRGSAAGPTCWTLRRTIRKRCAGCGTAGSSTQPSGPPRRSPRSSSPTM
jgi:hypothetical protein